MYFDQSPAAELANPNLFSFAFGPRYQRQSYRLVVRLKEWLIADWLSRVAGCFVVKLLAYATPNTYLGLLWLLADCHGWPHTDIATNTSSCTFQKVQNLLWKKAIVKNPIVKNPTKICWIFHYCFCVCRQITAIYKKPKQLQGGFQCSTVCLFATNFTTSNFRNYSPSCQGMRP